MKKRMASAVRFFVCGKCTNPGFVQQLAHISKLGLNSKIKKFSDSFICGKGYSSPFGGEWLFVHSLSSLFEGAGTAQP